MMYLARVLTADKQYCRGRERCFRSLVDREKSYLDAYLDLYHRLYTFQRHQDQAERFLKRRSKTIPRKIRSCLLNLSQHYNGTDPQAAR